MGLTENYGIMELKDLVLALFEEGKKPEDMGMRPVKQLDEIHDYVSLYFVDRKVGTVSALHIEEYFPINEEMGGVVKGEWDLGGYNKEQKCFYSLGKYAVTRWPPHQTFVTQQRLSTDETYLEDWLELLRHK